MCGMRASHCGPLPADGVGPGVARTLCPVCRLSGSPHRQVLLQRRAALLQARLLQVRNMHGWSPILSVRQCPGVVHGVQHTHTHTPYIDMGVLWTSTRDGGIFTDICVTCTTPMHPLTNDTRALTHSPLDLHSHAWQFLD